jgi:nitroreductase
MKLQERLLLVLALTGSILATPSSPAAELLPIQLPKPRMEGGKPLLQALKERKSVRDFKADSLAPQVLSDLLWAGFGVNRPEIDHRTAPSAMNSQEIDIYVATADGLFLYDAKPHQLRPVLSEDIRAKTTGQPTVREAPVALIFVADLTRMTKAKPEDKEFYAGIDSGFISQNIYLFCASEGLATVVHDLDRPSLARAMKLKPEQKIVIAQAVGYPKN